MRSIWNFSTGLQCFCIALTEWFSQIQSVWSYRRFWLLPSGPTWHLNIRRFSCTNFYNTRLYKKSCSLSIHSPMIILTICETLQMIWAVINHFGGCQLVHFYLTTRLLHFGILVLSIQSNPRCYIHLRWCFFIITWHMLENFEKIEKNLWVCQLSFDHKVSWVMSLFPLMTLRHSDSAHSSPLLPPLQLLLLLLVLLLLVLLLLLPFSWPQCAGTIRVWRTSQPRLPGGLS